MMAKSSKSSNHLSQYCDSLTHIHSLFSISRKCHPNLLMFYVKLCMYSKFLNTFVYDIILYIKQLKVKSTQAIHGLLSFYVYFDLKCLQHIVVVTSLFCVFVISVIQQPYILIYFHLYNCGENCTFCDLLQTLKSLVCHCLDIFLVSCIINQISRLKFVHHVI